VKYFHVQGSSGHGRCASLDHYARTAYIFSNCRHVALCVPRILVAQSYTLGSDWPVWWRRRVAITSKDRRSISVAGRSRRVIVARPLSTTSLVPRSPACRPAGLVVTLSSSTVYKERCRLCSDCQHLLLSGPPRYVSSCVSSFLCVSVGRRSDITQPAAPRLI